MEEISILINNRFGYGTWRQIVNERAKRIQEEKERIAEAKRIKRKQREETIEFIKIGSIIMGSAITIIIIAAVLIKVLT